MLLSYLFKIFKRNQSGQTGSEEYFENTCPDDNRILFRRDYDHIMNVVDYMENGIVGKIAFLNFAIDIICRELESETTAKFLRMGLNQDFNEPYGCIPYFRHESERNNVSLADYHIISNIWSGGKLSKAVYDEFVKGHISEEYFCDGFLYKELNLVIIQNGRHHTTVAKLKGQAQANKLYVISLKESFSRVSSDGCYWTYEIKGKSYNREVLDYRLALLFYLAKRCYELSLGHDIKEPDHTPLKGNCQHITENPTQYLEELRRRDNEIDVLKNEIALLKQHNQRMQKALNDAGIPDRGVGT